MATALFKTPKLRFLVFTQIIPALGFIVFWFNFALVFGLGFRSCGPGIEMSVVKELIMFRQSGQGPWDNGSWEKHLKLDVL